MYRVAAPRIATNPIITNGFNKVSFSPPSSLDVSLVFDSVVDDVSLVLVLDVSEEVSSGMVRLTFSEIWLSPFMLTAVTTYSYVIPLDKSESVSVSSDVVEINVKVSLSVEFL